MRRVFLFLLALLVSDARAMRLATASAVVRQRVPPPRLDQSAPVNFEQADDESRTAKRIETVLSRRTSRLIVILERLFDGHNYSAIFRTCETLGIQQIWMIKPPEERFASRRSLTRGADLERAEKYARADANRLTTDEQLQPGSRRARKRARAERAWQAERTPPPPRLFRTRHACTATWSATWSATWWLHLVVTPGGYTRW